MNAAKNDETKKLLEDACEGDCIGNPRVSTVNTKRLVFGNNGVIFSYDAEKESWEEWEGENHGEEFGAVIVGENVFIMGGEKEIDGELQRQSSVSIYNVTTKKWKKGPSMTKRRSLFGACVSPDNTIFVIGGFRDRHDYLNSVESLDCNENGEPIGGWKALTPMSTMMSDFEAAVIDDKIYAVGGYDGGKEFAQIEVFDPKLNFWKNCHPMSQPRCSHSVATYNRELYVFGDESDCEKYNPDTDTWTTIAPYPVGANFRGSAVMCDKIYLVGGNGCKETDIYDPKTNTWSKGPQLPKFMTSTKCVAWK